VAAVEGYVIAASSLGKLKTVSQIVAIMVILLQELPIPFLPLLSNVVLYFAVLITVYSGIDYFKKGKGFLMQDK
jgi:CDP-diacylglycerol--glycerol-3-phosphate 3-phosphatidyltransferase